MADQQLTQLLINLAEAIRDVPEGPEHKAIVSRFFAVIQHLEAKGTLSKSDIWHLGSRRGRDQ